MTAKENALGSGEAWAKPMGANEAHSRLMRFMVNLTLAEFLELANMIESCLPGGVERDDFLDKLRLLKALPPAPVRQTLLHPVWIYWVRSTRQIAQAWITAKEIAPQWQGHLHPEDRSSLAILRESLALFPILVLAAYMLAEREIDLVFRFRKDQYLSIPGTDLCFDISDSSSVAGSLVALPVRLKALTGCESHLQLSIGQAPGLQVTFHIQDGRVWPVQKAEAARPPWLQTVSLSDCTFEINNHDDRILQSWVLLEIYPAGIQVTPASDSEIPAWQTRLSQAMDMLGTCCPSLRQEIANLLRCVVPVTSHRQGHSVSCSSRDFWGAVQVSPHPGIAMAEVLAHEYRHNLLNALTEVDPIIDNACPDEARFYSPWRPDPRPLIGLLHGIYSFTEVVGFYQAYLKHFGKQAPQAELAQERITSNTCRLQLAAQELAFNAKFTEFGKGLFRGLQQRIEDFDQEVAKSDGVRRDAIFQQLGQQHSNWLVRQTPRS